MSQIEFVILDLDDTLCDYAGAKTQALAEAAALLAAPDEPASEIIAHYLEREPGLFRRYANGEIDLAAYRYQRFQQAVSATRDEEQINAANACYMAGANLGVRLFSDARPLLADLIKRNLSVAILTNGPGDGQRDKLRVTGLDVLVPAVFISAETGFAKPDWQAFTHVADHFALPASACLMVGDDFGNDIEPARSLGMTALHLVRGEPAVPGQIATLSEVLGFLA